MPWSWNQGWHSPTTPPTTPPASGGNPTTPPVTPPATPPATPPTTPSTPSGGISGLFSGASNLKGPLGEFFQRVQSSPQADYFRQFASNPMIQQLGDKLRARMAGGIPTPTPTGGTAPDGGPIGPGGPTGGGWGSAGGSMGGISDFWRSRLPQLGALQQGSIPTDLRAKFSTFLSNRNPHQ